MTVVSGKHFPKTMTTVAFGGGPSLDQRRSFAALRDGTHVPGYRGYCPQIKYRVGKTYGTDTHELAQEVIHVAPTANVVSNPQMVARVTNQLPEATGDNKYTQNMVPGYTGYIPRMPYKFGNTYKEDCDVCIDQHITNYKYHDAKLTDLQRQVNGYPRLRAISFDPDVRDKLNMYRDTHPQREILLENKRPLTEPPIPGYRGYIPRIKTTEQGLGCRYNQTTRKGLELFVQETAQHARTAGSEMPKSLKSVPMEKLQVPTTGTASADLGTSTYRRLYQQDGMIPKYTGYIPHKRYVFGNTYGDTTRQLSVCAHPMDNYGQFIRSKTMA